MLQDARGPSTSEHSGGDDARDLYEQLTDDLLYDPAIGRATMMGYPCVRLAGRFLASYDDKARCLVVKLPRGRVCELVDNGDGDRGLWQTVLSEAVDFARKPLSDER